MTPLPSSGLAGRALAWARIDLHPPHRPPAWWRVVLATLLALALSLLADAAIVAVGTRVFPSTKGYVHFQFHDYARLTVIGVLIACAAWPVVVRCCSAPRWLFFRLAIAVTLVLFLPDFYILAQGAAGTRRWPCSCACTWPSRSSPTTCWCTWRRSARRRTGRRVTAAHAEASSP